MRAVFPAQSPRVPAASAPLRWVFCRRVRADARPRPAMFGGAVPLVLLLSAMAGAAPSERGCIRDWLVLGPFKEDDLAGRLKKPVLPDEEGSVPQAGQTVQGAAWRTYQSPTDSIDFFSDTLAFPHKSNAVAYAFTFVFSPSARPAWLRMGSDDGLAVWLNGDRVWFNDVYRSEAADQDVAPARLQHGWNLLLVKVTQGVGQWSFILRLTDGEGRPLSDLKYALEMPAARAPEGPVHPVPVLGIGLEPAVAGPDGAVRFPLSVRVRNLSAEAAGAAAVTLSLEPGRPAAPAADAGALGPWARRSVTFPLALEDALALARAEKAGVEVRIGGASCFGGIRDEFLPGLFHALAGGIRIAGWKVVQGNPPGAEAAAFDDKAAGVAVPGTELVPQAPVLWLRARVQVPAPLAGAPLGVTVAGAGGKGEVFVDGARAGEAGGGAVPLPPGAGERFIAVRIEAESARALTVPGAVVECADEGARACARDLATFEQIFPDLGPEVLKFKREAVAALAGPGAAEYVASLGGLGAFIRGHAAGLKDYAAWFVGQSHIDMVWLWRWEESLQIFQDTFGQALRFIDEHPRYTYSQSQAAAYLATEQHHPQLFERIRKAVKTGRWCIVGGMWVEPDLNLPSGESLVRQLLYGKRYFLDRFGVDVSVGWNPDSFGHTSQLPQILRKSGIDSYFFFRCGKDRRLFWWEGIDGSRVLAQATSTPASPGIVKEVKASEAATGSKTIMNLFGAGDHGGGPTRDDLQRIDRLRETALFPTVDYGTPDKAFAAMRKAAKDIPVVKEEMNFLCEGCYTTHGRTKRANRWSENLLGSTEAAAAIAVDFGLPFPRREFEQHWRMVLFNQFHDLLPGSGIHEIYDDAARDYEAVFRFAGEARRAALEAIAAQVKTAGDGVPVIVFNLLGHARTEVAEAEVAYGGALGTLAVYDETGQEVPSQTAPGSGGYRPVRVLFLARDLPPVGYRVFWVRDAGAGKKTAFPAVAVAGGKIESDRFVLELDPASGCLRRLYDKAAGREALAAAPPAGAGAAGNLLQLLGDRGPMSAWFIAYTGEQWNLDQGAKVEVIERGPVRAVVRVTRTFKDARPECTFGQASAFHQDFVVAHGVDRIDIAHDLEWQERYKLLKLAFPAAVEGGTATAEIAYGAIIRPADGKDYPCLNWVDLSGGGYGLSVLNDARHGYDVNGRVLRMHLLRSSFDPDPAPDRGRHRFVISLYPHAGDWREAATPRRGRELNLPLVAWSTPAHGGALPPSATFAGVEPANVGLGALKRAEDDDAVVVRVYEAHGASATAARVHLWKPVAKAVETDLLERGGTEVKIDDRTIEVPLGPYEIKTLKVLFR